MASYSAMTDEELLRRFRRIRAAFGDVSQLHLEAAPAALVSSPTSARVFQDWSGGRSQEHMEKDLNSILAEVTGLMDRAKGWMNAQGRDEQLVPTFMKGNRSVALMQDLANADKHQELTRPPFSGHRPRLANVRRVMRTVGTLQMQMGRDGRMIATGPGSASLILTGEILDENGVLLAELDAVIDEALSQWEGFFNTHGLTLT